MYRRKLQKKISSHFDFSIKDKYFVKCFTFDNLSKIKYIFYRKLIKKKKKMDKIKYNFINDLL